MLLFAPLGSALTVSSTSRALQTALSSRPLCRPGFLPPALTKESTPVCAGEPWPLSGRLCDCGQDI